MPGHHRDDGAPIPVHGLARLLPAIRGGDQAVVALQAAKTLRLLGRPDLLGGLGELGHGVHPPDVALRLQWSHRLPLMASLGDDHSTLTAPAGPVPDGRIEADVRSG